MKFSEIVKEFDEKIKSDWEHSKISNVKLNRDVCKKI